MIEAGILDGDKVIVRSQTIAENGDIIVAMTEEDEATVKRFYKEKIVIDYNLKIVQWSQFTNVVVIGKNLFVLRNVYFKPLYIIEIVKPSFLRNLLWTS